MIGVSDIGKFARTKWVIQLSAARAAPNNAAAGRDSGSDTIRYTRSDDEMGDVVRDANERPIEEGRSCA